MVCIIGNPKGKAWSFINKVYQKVNKKFKKSLNLQEEVELIELKIKEFRDKEIKVKISENIREKVCFFIHDSSLRPDRWFLELALTNYALKFSSASKIIDVLPYLLFSRQDRKDESRVAINAKAVADLISMYTDRVITCELHAPQIQGFYSIPLDNLFAFPVVVKYIFSKYKSIQKNLVIMSPDTGGVERARAFLNRYSKIFKKEAELAFAYKYRPKPGEIGEYHILGDVEGKDVFIVDDIIDSGGTLINAAKSLKQLGAKKIYAYATHALFTEGFEKLKDYFDRVFISNTRPPTIKDKKLEVIDLSELFAEAIYRISNKQSLSSLFE